MPRDLKDGEWVWSGYDRIIKVNGLAHDIGVCRYRNGLWMSSILPHSMKYEQCAGERYKTEKAAILGAFKMMLDIDVVEEDKKPRWLLDYY